MAKITLTIADSKLAEFKQGFLKQNPIPQDEEGNPLYSENAWIKQWIIGQAVASYKAGKHKLAVEAGFSWERDIIQ